MYADASKWASPEVGAQVDPTLSECAKGSVAYRPQKGDAFMFWSFKPDGVSMGPFAQHTGSPPTKGVKWAAPMWIHSRPFRPDTASELRRLQDSCRMLNTILLCVCELFAPSDYCHVASPPLPPLN